MRLSVSQYEVSVETLNFSGDIYQNKHAFEALTI